MKIYGIGLSRTGTTTLHEALLLLGYRSVHAWRPSQLHTFEAATDVPAAARYQKLDRQYPGAKFILTVRELSSWLESCRKTWQERKLRTMLRWPSVAVEYAYCRMKLYGTLAYERDRFARAYERHLAEVRQHFAARPGDLLELDVCAGEGWEKVCPFLGKEIPDKPFPWRHRWAGRRDRQP